MPRDKTGHFYYSRYPTIWQADTQSLSLQEDGAYMRLCDHYMVTRAPLSSDDRALARIIGVGLDEWQAIKNKVLSFFKPIGLLLHHSFCDEVLENDNSRITKLRTNGSKGGRPSKRKLTINNQLVSETESLPTQNNSKQQVVSKEIDKESISSGDSDKSQPPPKKRAEPKGFKIIFDFEKLGFEEIPESLKAKWRETYPAVDVDAQIRAAEAWLIANPKRAKSNYNRFLNTWLCDKQDKARSPSMPGMRAGSSRFEQAPENPEDRFERMKQKGLL